MPDFETQLDAHIERLNHEIELGQHEEIKAFNETLHPADMALILKALDENQRSLYFSLLDFEEASAVLSEINPELFCELIQNLDSAQRMVILDLMSQDDIVDKLGELDDEKRMRILTYLEIDDAMEVAELLDYEEDSAGGRMTKDYITLMANMTADEAIVFLRENAPDAETIYYVFVVNHEDKLEGVVSLRELIVSKGSTLIADIMNPHVITIDEDMDQEEVARLFKKYDFLVMPVVNEHREIKGIITIDDVIDVIDEEATEDILMLAGSSELEDFDEDDSSIKRVVYAVRSRLPWLIVTIFGGLLSAGVISRFSGALSANETLALFMPLLAGMGGNVGTQSSTITVRTIALTDIEGWNVVKTLLQEVSVGIIVGTVCSLIVAAASFMTKGQLILSFIVGIAMFANIVTAATIGTLVPLFFKKVGIDPAVASAPFISTTIDITGLSIYFSLAAYMMHLFA